jgi:hypothetical protein
MPEPEYLACFPEEDRAGVPLAKIISQLTPRDVEFWSLQHGKFGYYWFQYKLCDEGVAGSCWYCSRFGQRQLPNLSFFPIVPLPDGERKWMDLLARVDLQESGDPRSQQGLTDSSLPSVFLLSEWQACHELSEEKLELLVKISNLKKSSIVNHFKKKNENPSGEDAFIQ